MMHNSLHIEIVGIYSMLRVLFSQFHCFLLTLLVGLQEKRLTFKLSIIISR